MDINASRGMQEGLTEAQLGELDDYATSAHFSTRERLALAYSDRITLSDRDVDEAFFRTLQAQFPTPAEIVELTAIVAFEKCAPVALPALYARLLAFPGRSNFARQWRRQ